MSEFVTNEAFKEFSNRMDETNKTQDSRLDKVERAIEQIQSLTVSVEKMAVSIESMAKEIQKQGTKIENMEKKPADNWDKLLWIIGTAIVGAILGYLLKSIGL